MGWLGNATLRLVAEIALIIVVAVLARWLLRRLIRRFVRQAGHAEDIRNPLRRKAIGMATAWAGERGAQRAAALGSLAMSVTTVVIGGLAIFGILSVLGHNITPLIASAGVVGVALGFGAQNLVKDLIAGVGMLLEDQLGVGDIVDMENASGVVEAVGLRVTRLRDATGIIWYVRNGEVLRVGNKSQGSSQIILDVTVAYDTDIAACEKVITAVVDTLVAEPEFADLIVDPPRLVGVEQVTGAGVTFRVLGSCRANENFAIERELRVRIKAALDEARIKLPVPPAPSWPSGGSGATAASPPR